MLEGSEEDLAESEAETASADADGPTARMECDEGEFAITLGWVEVDFGCGLGFEQPEGVTCDDEYVEEDVCLADACATASGACEWQVLAIEAAGLPLDTPSDEHFCFTSIEEACACLGCCDGTEMTREYESSPNLLQCRFVAR